VTGRRAGFWVLFLAFAAYAGSLGNGFAYDDEVIVETNPVVTEGLWSSVLTTPYWASGQDDGTLFRPVTTAALVAQWRMWRGEPAGFHATNVLLHALVSLSVLALFWMILPPAGALAGGAFFAVHPVHVEAVANVVGLAELLAALTTVSACLLYLKGADWTPLGRGIRAGGMVALYLTGLGSKEIAVTLPALLLLFEFVRPGGGADLRERLKKEAPVYLALGAALVAYLAWRGWVLGEIAGDWPAPAFFGLSVGERLLSAVSVWPEYARLLTVPMALSVDYGPPVITVAHGFTPEVGAGALVAVALVAGFVLSLKRDSALALGLAWLAVALLPVANLLFPVGVLLAERILYLPSVGAALAFGSVAGWWLAHPRARARRGAMLCLPVLGLLLLGRTVARNPVWMSTYSMLESLNRDHPESYYAHWKRAEGLVRVGLPQQARADFDVAVALVPGHYGLLCSAADFMYDSGDTERAEALLRQAIAVRPDQASAYRLLGGQLLQQGRGRDAHRTVLEGLARHGPDRQLSVFLAESYVAKGDLEAAVRALEAVIASGAGLDEDAERLAELLEALS